MSKLHSSSHIVKVLQKKGFYFVTQKGSHAKFYKTITSKTIIVIVPIGYKEIPHGTFHSILRQSGLAKSDFK
jgi:predicted RNA binding protein YcfA (HicA-like mRNA interferase family)